MLYVHQCQAQNTFEIWPSPECHLLFTRTLTDSPDHHLTIPDSYQTLTQPSSGDFKLLGCSPFYSPDHLTIIWPSLDPDLALIVSLQLKKELYGGRLTHYKPYFMAIPEFWRVAWEWPWAWCLTIFKQNIDGVYNRSDSMCQSRSQCLHPSSSALSRDSAVGEVTRVSWAPGSKWQIRGNIDAETEPWPGQSRAAVMAGNKFKLTSLLWWVSK